MAEEIENMEQSQQVDQIEQNTQDQNPQPPKSHKLYDNLIADGYTSDNLGTKEEFAAAMSDSAKADKFYNTLIKEGYTIDNLGDKNEFIQSMSQKKNIGQSSQDGGTPGTSQSQLPLQSQPQEESQEEENPINLVLQYNKLSKEASQGNEVAISGSTGGAGVSTIVDTKKLTEANNIKSRLKKSGIDEKKQKEISDEFSDFPMGAEKIEIKREDGTIDKPYSFESLNTLRNKDYGAYLDKINGIKNYFDLKNAVGTNKANEYARLQYSDNPQSSFYDRVQNFEYTKNKQAEIIEKNLTGEEKEKALNRLNQNSEIWAIQSFPTATSAKQYLSQKLLNEKSSLSPIRPNANDLYVGEVAYNGDDLDAYSLESIKSKLDPNNKIDQLIFNKYKQGIDLKDAISHSATLDDAALDFSTKQNETLKGQQNLLGQEGIELPNSMKGSLVQNFLNNEDVKALAASNPDIARMYKQTQQNLYFNYPDFAKKNVATIISQAREDNGMNNWLVNIPTQESTDKLVNDLVAQGKLTEQDKAVYEKQIRPDLGVLQSVKRGLLRIPFGAFVEKSPIATPGILENTEDALNKTIKGTAESIEDLASIFNPITPEIFPDESQRAYNVLQDNYNNVAITPKGKLHEVSEATGNLCGFMIPMMFGGYALGGSKAAHFINNALMFEGGNRDKALTLFPDDPIKRYLYTTLSTAGDVMLGELLPNKEARQGVANLLKSDIEKITNGLVNKTITEEAARKTLLEKATEYVPKLAVENAKVAGTMTGFGAFHNTVDALFGANNMNAGDIVYDAVKTFKSTYLTTPLLAAIGMHGKAGDNKMNGKILMEVASNPDTYMKVIENEAATTKEGAATKNEKIENLKNAVSIKSDLDGINLTNEQKEKYLVTALSQKVWERKATSTSDETIAKQYLDKAEEAKKQKEQIISGIDKADDYKNYTENAPELELTKQKTETYDKKNITGLPSEVGVGEKPIEAKPIEGAGKEETTTGGVLQAPGVSGEGESVGEKVESKIPEEISSLKDDEIKVFTVKDINEIPEQFRDRAVKTEGLKAEVRKKILGLPIGKKYEITFGEGYRYKLTGKEAKDYAQSLIKETEVPKKEKIIEETKAKLPETKATTEEPKAELPKQEDVGEVKAGTPIEKLEKEYRGKSVDELVKLKKELYPSPDIETPMSKEEKLLDKVIADKFSDINQEILRKRKAKKEEVKAELTEQKPIIEEKTTEQKEAELPKQKKRKASEIAVINRVDAKKIYKEVSTIDEPVDAIGATKHWLAIGNKVNTESFAEDVSGFIRSKGAAKTSIPIDAKMSEFTSSDKKTPSINKAAHDIWESLPEHIQESVTDQDVRNALIDHLQSYGKRIDIAKDFIKEYSSESTIEKYYKDIEESENAAFEKEMKDLNEWMQQTGEEEGKLRLDEDYINNLIKQYEQESETKPGQLETEDKGVTKGETAGAIEEVGSTEGARQEKPTEPAEPTKIEIEEKISTTEEIFKNAPKSSSARNKYFIENFGEKSNIAESIYQENGKDYESMAKAMESELPKIKEGGEGIPPTKEEIPTTTLSPEEKWTAIKQEKLKEIESIRKLFEKEKGTTWSRIQQEALEDVAKEYPNKSLNDAIRTRVEKLASKYDEGEKYNPTSYDLAVIQEFKRQTESNIESVKDDLDSNNELDRFVAMSQIESYENDLLNIGKASFKREAGTAFGFRASESRMDENYGLTIRRAQLTRANGGEKLSEADNKFLESKWEKEKELMKKEQEIREQGLKDDFDKKIESLQKEYEAKLKDKTSQTKTKTLSQKGKDVANQIRKLKLKGTKIDFTIGSWNIAIEGIAKLVEGGATIAEAIETLIKDKTISFKSNADKDSFESEISARIKNLSNRDESFEKIKKITEDTKDTNITNDMVAKKLISDYVNSFVGDVEQSEVINEATKGLKEILPDVNKKTLRSAYLKEGEFKQPTKRNLENSINEEKRNLKRLESKEYKKEASENELQKNKLEQEKEKSKRAIKEYERKLKEEEFSKEEPISLKKQDVELIELNKQKKAIEGEFNKKRRELEEKNKHWLQRAADFARSSYIAALIGSPVTLAKVAYMSIVRPASEATRKIVLGKVFDNIFPSISEAAKKGGESSSIKNIQKGIEAYFFQMGKEKMQAKFEKSKNEYELSVKKYQDALNSNADEKTLDKLKKDMDNKLLSSTGNIMYQFIGGSSIKDAIGALINRANEIEKQFGKTDIESIKDGNKLDKLNYILGFIGRSHSAAKTFSGRFSFAAGFMARLEGAARDGSISDPNRIIEIAHESYIDWERGKYQQDNWVTKKWNDTLKSIRDKTVGKGEWSKYDKALEALLRTDVAITRVPVNILHEAVTEYTLGAIRAPWLAYKEYAKAKKIAIDEGYSKAIDSDEFKDRVKDIISKMDANQAAKIFRLFTKGGLGLGLYGLAAMTGMVQFGVFPHKGQKKKKEEEYLKEGELNPGQIMFGKDRLGEISSKLIEHTPALWTTFMGLGIAKIYADDVKAGKIKPQAAWDALYTHLQIMESGIPQTKVFSPLEAIKRTSKAFAGKLSSYGIFDNYIDAKGGFVNQEKKKLQMTSPEVLRLKEFKVEPPILGVRSQNKIEVDSKHPKEGLSKDGKPYAYMNDFEWEKFNEYRKSYIDNALKELYQANDSREIELNQTNLTDAIESITRQATVIAKNKLIEEGLLPEKNQEEENKDDDIKNIIKDIYENAKQ